MGRSRTFNQGIKPQMVAPVAAGIDEHFLTNEAATEDHQHRQQDAQGL